jgi:hypothetical protein
MQPRRSRPHAFAAAWLALLLALLLSAPASAQTKSFSYDRIDVTIDVRPDGTLDVAETMTLAYQGGPFSSANRAIALQRLDNLREIAVGEGAQAYTEAQSDKRPGTFVVQRAADNVKVTWYYPPTSDTTRTFTLRYRVDGAVRVGDAANEIWWVAIFPDRSVPVQRSQVTLNLPLGGKLRPEDITLPAAAGRVTVEENSVRIARDEALPGGQSLDVRVQFPPTLVAAQKPAWQDAPAPQPAPRPAAVSSPSNRSRGNPLDGCWIPIFILLVVGSLIWRAITGNWDFSSSSSSSSHRRSSSSWSSSSSSSSWDSGSSSSSDGGSGGGGGGAE